VGSKGSKKINTRKKNTWYFFLVFIFWVAVVVFLFFLLFGLRVIKQYEKGVVLTLGKYTGTRGAGLRWIF